MSTADVTRNPDRYGRLARVAVVVLSKDEPALAETLRTLAPQLEALDGECIVVDASAGRLEWIRVEFPYVTWIDYQGPLGVGVTIPHQRNVGVRASTAPVIAFCDSGGIPSDRWLELLTEPLQRPSERRSYQSGDTPAQDVPSLTVTCGPVESVRASVYRVINDLPDGTVVDTVLTANLAFTREAFDAVGGFDERYQYGSDADFAWRLIQAGHPPISVQAATMGMNWGNSNLQHKRAWRYGKARARLWRFHPARRLTILRNSPEVLVYPAWFFTLMASVAVAFGTPYRFAPLIVASFLGVLVYRNRSATKPLAVLVDHFIYSSAFFGELLRTGFTSVIAPSPLVAHMPKDPGPYQPYLLDALTVAGVSSGYVPSPTRSKTLNLALLPVTCGLLRLRGTRIVHLHWVHDFSLTWSAGRPFAGRLTRAWLGLWLHTLRFVGLRLVWTAHNVVPHKQTFDDDHAGRRRLVAGTDALITHTDGTLAELRERFGATGRPAFVIEQGATPPPADLTREIARQEFGLDAGSGTNSETGPNTVPSTGVGGTERPFLVIVGKIERYKGILTLLTELERRTTVAADQGRPVGTLAGARLAIAGACSDPVLLEEITASVQRLVACGLDITLEPRNLSEREFWSHLLACDVALFPFAAITNSGSLVAALSASAPSLVTDLEAFDAITTDAVIKAGPEISAYVDTLIDLVELYPATRADRLNAMRLDAARWVSERGWDRTAASTRVVYELLLGKGVR